MQRTRRIAEALFSGTLIYVVMASCQGSTGSGGSSAGGAGGAHVDSDGSGILDALMDPVPEADAHPTSGTRLKARTRVGDDGSKEYITQIEFLGATAVFSSQVWFDSERNEDCVFRLAADGKMRCLPGVTSSARSYSLPMQPGASVGAVFRYADSGCTTAYIVMPGPPTNCDPHFTPPKYVLEGVPPANECVTYDVPQPLRVFKVGAAIDPGDITEHWNRADEASGAICEHVAGAPLFPNGCGVGCGGQPGQIFTASEIALSKFVASSVDHDP